MRSLYKSPLGPCIPANALGGGGKSLPKLMSTGCGPSENLAPVNGLVEVKIGFSVDYSRDLLLLIVEFCITAALIDDSGINELS